MIGILQFFPKLNKIVFISIETSNVKNEEKLILCICQSKTITKKTNVNKTKEYQEKLIEMYLIKNND